MKQKVMIGYPVGGSVHPAFCKSLLDVQRFELQNPSEDYELVDIEYSASLYVQENRNNLVEWALEKGVDWLLQVDTDEKFQPTLLRQLMNTADKDTRPIVFGLYSNVQPAPAQAEGAYYHVDMIFREVENGEYSTLVPTTDVNPFLVDAAGTGILLTHMSIFKKIGYPWFWLEMIVPTGKTRPQIMNEDIAFCRAAREAGYQLWCDPLAEAQHFKSIALLPSSFRRFMERAQQVEQEMKALG
jgi:GT2 family glycosyltransferase